MIRKDFDTKEEAFDWMTSIVDDNCNDNHRFAYEDDSESMYEYELLRENGCCAIFDAEIFIQGKNALIGCNYGH